jgi:hypothetical protein
MFAQHVRSMPLLRLSAHIIDNASPGTDTYNRFLGPGLQFRDTYCSGDGYDERSGDVSNSLSPESIVLESFQLLVRLWGFGSAIPQFRSIALFPELGNHMAYVYSHL